MKSPADPLEVTIARGNIYLAREVYDSYFKDVECLALMPDEEGVLLIPLIQQSAGGLLLKVKNLRGDRVVHAQEFWRLHGYAEEFAERAYKVRWKQDRAALLLIGLLPSPPIID
jgi:hypothetical protein